MYLHRTITAVLAVALLALLTTPRLHATELNEGPVQTMEQYHVQWRIPDGTQRGVMAYGTKELVDWMHTLLEKGQQPWFVYRGKADMKYVWPKRGNPREAGGYVWVKGGLQTVSQDRDYRLSWATPTGRNGIRIRGSGLTSIWIRQLYSRGVIRGLLSLELEDEAGIEGTWQAGSGATMARIRFTIRADGGARGYVVRNNLAMKKAGFIESETAYRLTRQADGSWKGKVLTRGADGTATWLAITARVDGNRLSLTKGAYGWTRVK